MQTIFNERGIAVIAFTGTPAESKRGYEEAIKLAKIKGIRILHGGEYYTIAMSFLLEDLFRKELEKVLQEPPKDK
jgi:hypothetical protein